MTRTGSSKGVDAGYWAGRLQAAKDFRASAKDMLDLANPNQRSGPIISNIVLAAIAYTDALTGKFSGLKNQVEHGAAVKTLRSALGNGLPQSQVTALTRLLGMKDQAQYGARASTIADANSAMDLLTKYADWAEGLLSE